MHATIMGRMKVAAAAAGMVAAAAGQAWAAGNLATSATVISLDLNADKTLSKQTLEVETGKYYRLDLTNHLTGGDVVFMAPDFYRNIWVNQAKIGNFEIKTMTMYALEFDDMEGTIQFTFVPIRTGTYKFWVQGREDAMSGSIVVR